MDILRHLGCSAMWQEDEIVTTQTAGGDCHIPDTLMGAMRSSIVFLGAIMARFGCAELTLPGGCELGSRPIDLHLTALTLMGAQIIEDGKTLICTAPEGLHGAEISLPFPSVGATENVIIAAATAKGTTVLRGGAREPEIGDLITFLVRCGADIQVAIDGTVTIRGVAKLGGCQHRVIPDRIAAGTYLAAAAITGGQLELTGIKPSHILSTLAILSNAGCMVKAEVGSVLLTAPRRMKELGTIKTGPYPGFPTDMQAVMMAVSATAEGTTTFVENIFDNRYRHIPQLRKLGCDIVYQGRIAVVSGVPALHGAAMSCTDLRGGAALVLAALAAEGESIVTELQHIDRGYENFSENLLALGAKITRNGR
ncbi:MAG: UDP-N-acetylglucosamine 1-carboxyvinyltransferase, partial [Angelakisella sp.]